MIFLITHIPFITAQEPPSLLIFSGAHSTLFRTMKLRPRKDDCIVCGKNPSLTELIDYVQFCGRGATDKVIISSLATF
jgi:adenylyltransferase/sulfurtransferase